MRIGIRPYSTTQYWNSHRSAVNAFVHIFIIIIISKMGYGSSFCLLVSVTVYYIIIVIGPLDLSKSINLVLELVVEVVCYPLNCQWSRIRPLIFSRWKCGSHNDPFYLCGGRNSFITFYSK